MSGSSNWDRVQAEFACAHPTTRLTKKTASNGVLQFRLQCQECGATVQNFKHSDLKDFEKKSAPEYDEGLKRSWWERKSARLQELQQADWDAEKDARRREYAVFMASARWAQLRKAALIRDNHVCQGCLVRRATQVHHRDYSRFGGGEMLFDLISVCDQCHDAIHNNAPDGIAS